MTNRDPADTTSKRSSRRPGERTCVGCGEHEAKGSMIRVVLGPDGHVAVDLAGHEMGRGAYVHARRACIDKAAPAGLARAFRSQIRCDANCLLELVTDAAERRVKGLFVSAKRSGNLVFGRDQVSRDWFDGRLHLVVVASDAGSMKNTKFLNDAVARGRLVVWGDRKQLGSVFDLDDVTVVGVQNASLAEAIAEVCRLPDKVRAGAEVR